MIFDIKCDLDDIDNILLSMRFNIKDDDCPEEPLKEYGFSDILNIHRNKIDKINTNLWKKVRWYINDYDFLVKDPIINRAFYKYWEIINVFDVFRDYTENDIIFHCAEAPGGFIQGSNIYLQLENDYKQIEIKEPLIDKDGFTRVQKKKRKNNNKKYKIYTISLNKDLPQYRSYNLPSYNKCVINKNVCVTYGKNNTGDINNLDNIHYVSHLVGDDGCYLVTADGGFDEGTDFNNKEQLHYYLILNEIYANICLQKINGIFILKVFDIFTDTSIHLLYLLNLIYKEIYVYKPKTSRPTNSEKYIICKHLMLQDKTHVLNILKQLSEKFKIQKKYMSFTLFDSISQRFIDNIKHMNITLLNVQCDFLKRAIELCEDETFIKNYDAALEVSLDMRRQVFKKWEKMYNLSCYIPH